MSPTLPTLPELHVDLDALVQNYTWFCNQAPNSKTAAAVKANAYGLGMERIAPTLRSAGCTSFFVAHLGEAIALRKILGTDAVIYVLHGPVAEDVHYYLAHDLYPVLNSDAQIALWHGSGNNAPAALHIDTGINRLGIAFDKAKFTHTKHLNLSLLMSHLACASTPDHPQNTAQLQKFNRLTEHFTDIPTSLSNSAGVLLGSKYHFALTRPGIGLYGGSPLDHQFEPPPTSPVAKLRAPVLQIRSVAAGQSIGYGAIYTAAKPMKIAILAYGYADGLPRSAGPGASGWIDGQAVPLVGKVSMDLMAVDISNLDQRLVAGNFVDFLGQDLNAFSHACATLPYGILTSIGPRVQRIYKGATS